MEEYLCLTILAQPGESEAAFKSRLVAFWTHMLRNHPDDYERVYAEEVAFEQEKGLVARRYMIEPEVAERITAQLKQSQFGFVPIDDEDLYSKDEASSREWFQLDH